MATIFVSVAPNNLVPIIIADKDVVSMIKVLNSSSYPYQIEAFDVAQAEQNKNICLVESFVGSPGDFSPPECNCEKCISKGTGYRYVSKGLKPGFPLFGNMFILLSSLPETKHYQWGIEYSVPGQCSISMCNCSNQTDMHIRSNKEIIKIGKYLFNHTSKEFVSGQNMRQVL